MIRQHSTTTSVPDFMKPSVLTRIISFIIASVILLSGCSDDRQASISSEPERNPVLLISIDGFINSYVDRNETPDFDRFLRQAVQAEHLIPVFPPNTFPSHWSIATGLHVENHGIIANSFYDYELEARFSYGPQGTPNDERWWGGEPIWATAEKQGKTAVTFFWPGSEASIYGVQPTRWMDYDGSVPDSVRIDSVMTWLDPAGETQADFGTLYFSFVDSRGHRYGPDAEEVDESVKEMDGLIGYLLDRMEAHGLSESLNILLVSDHGMAATSPDRVIFLEDLINLNDVDVVAWSPAGMLKPREGKTETVYQALKEKEEEYAYRVFLRDELPERFHFRNHYRIPEIILLADIGYTITNRPFFNNRGVLAGTHGYDNRDPEMFSFFAAKGPAFRNGERVSGIEAIHLYELMAHLLGIEPAPNDGTLDEVIHLLKTD
ncbi:MAG: alkaline phosphatase family protein [Balneolaceae bacterium]|nr:MAG: alkaline phosphatase family protein [Balneolaceae bacterium]